MACLIMHHLAQAKNAANASRFSERAVLLNVMSVEHIHKYCLVQAN